MSQYDRVFGGWLDTGGSCFGVTDSSRLRPPFPSGQYSSDSSDNVVAFKTRKIGRPWESHYTVEIFPQISQGYFAQNQQFIGPLPEFPVHDAIVYSNVKDKLVHLITKEFLPNQ